MSSGQPKPLTLNIQPAIDGPAAEASDRGTLVTLAAAGRSSGVTTAITYEVRAGTSIADIVLRNMSIAIASGRDGMNGVSIRKILAGMWVYAIVLIRPTFFANHGAASWEKAESNPVQKKIVPVVATE